jgi:acyl-CoA reductase-like NAD-dependent aldehyde dehydrogenase
MMSVATSTKTCGLWINGAEVPAADGATFDVVNPATGETFASVAKGSAEDVDRAVAAARAALTGKAWTRMGPTARSKAMHRFADLLLERMDELATLESRNVGKAISSVKAEIHGAAEVLRFFAAGVAGHTGPAVPLMGGTLMSYTLKEPVGVCAQIVPWNYPLMMSVWKLAPALAAGCTIVLKPATYTPLTALELGKLASEAGFPEGVVNVIPGPGSSTGSYLVQHPGVDKVAFTGDTETGTQIMQLSSPGLKRVTLELGGKSPNLVFADADLASAVPSSVWSIFYSAGQSCEARSRVLVERGIHDEFVERFVAAAGKLVVGDPLDPATHVGSLISEGQVETVDGYVRAGRAAKCEVALGGERLGGELANGCFYAPTVLTQVDNSMTVAQEEIFGPVVCIIPFEGEAEAVQLANDVEYGLMASVWTQDPARGHRVAAGIKSGMVGINVPYTAFAGVPFGGFKRSGFGRELSLESLEEYTEAKGVIFGTGSRTIDPFRIGG